MRTARKRALEQTARQKRIQAWQIGGDLFHLTSDGESAPRLLHSTNGRNWRHLGEQNMIGAVLMHRDALSRERRRALRLRRKLRLAVAVSAALGAVLFTAAAFGLWL